MLLAVVPLGAFSAPRTYVGGGGGSTVCGNNVCEAGENDEDCFVDCGNYLNKCLYIPNPVGQSYKPTANQICANAGLDKCAGGFASIQQNYYNSTDSTCNGNIQVVESTLEPTECVSYVGNVNNCVYVSGDAEPFKGDVGIFKKLDGAICCS